MADSVGSQPEPGTMNLRAGVPDRSSPVRGARQAGFRCLVFQACGFRACEFLVGPIGADADGQLLRRQTLNLL